MAEIKQNLVSFLRLGAQTAVDRSTYEATKEANSHAIIFARVNENAGEWDVDSSEYVAPAHYIYANGIEYKVADSDALSYVIDKLKVLLDDADPESINSRIEDALAEYKPSAADIADLVDTEKSNVTVEEEDGKLILTAAAEAHASITVGSEDPEDHEFGHDPKHGDYYVKEEVITEKEGAEPRRTAYIYNADAAVWQVLDGNVDATNVFFKDGVDRTEAIGALAATEGGVITNEGKALNLKELLELYLVKEKWPEPINTHKASIDWPAFSIDITKPSTTVSSYITGYASFKEVGSTVTLGIPVIKEKIGYTDTASKSDDSYITGLAGGYFDSEGVKHTEEELRSTATSTASYSDNLDNANVSLKLNVVEGFDGAESRTSEITGLSTSTSKDISIGSQTATIMSGTNEIEVEWSCDATVTRSTSAASADALGAVKSISNKGNESTESYSVDAYSKDSSTVTASAASYTKKSATIHGVYPVYSNCKKLTAATAKNNDEGAWSTGTIDIVENGVDIQVTGEKLDLYDYIATKAHTFYIGAGNTMGIGISVDKTLYIPNTIGITNIKVDSWSPLDQAWTGGAGYFEESADVVTIGGVPYTKWVCVDAFPTQTMELKIS